MMHWSSQQCVITGTLGYVLWISRMFGLAPVTFQKNLNRGLCIQTSTAYDVYGKVLVVLICIFTSLALVLDTCLHPEKTIRMNTNTNRLVWVAVTQAVNLVVLTCCFTGLNRMKCLIKCLTDVEMIKSELKLYHYKPQSEKKTARIVFCSLIIGVLMLGYDFVAFMEEVIRINGDVVTSSFYAFYYLTCVMLHVTIVQFTVVTMVVLSTSKSLNQSLKNLLKEIIETNPHQNKLLINTSVRNAINLRNQIPMKSVNIIIDAVDFRDTMTTSPTRNIPSSLHRLGLIYCTLCEVIRQIDKSYGKVVVALFVSLTVHLIVTPYHLIICTFNFEKSDHSSAYSQIPWLIYHVSNMMLIIEPCHRTHTQLELTKILISRMTRFCPYDNKLVTTELTHFYNHLNLNKVLYAPMKMFTLNRSIVVAILGSVITYVVVILQL